MVYIRQYGILSFNITNFYQTLTNFIFTPLLKVIIHNPYMHTCLKIHIVIFLLL